MSACAVPLLVGQDGGQARVVGPFGLLREERGAIVHESRKEAVEVLAYSRVLVFLHQQTGRCVARQRDSRPAAMPLRPTREVTSSGISCRPHDGGALVSEMVAWRSVVAIWQETIRAHGRRA
jgi:hypothetical protein